MPQEFHFEFPLPNGLHARPASHLAEVAGRFASDITLFNSRTDAEANAKSVLSLVAAEVKLRDRCRVTATGPDEAAAIDALRRFVQQQLPHADDALPAIAPSATQFVLPRVLRGDPVRFLTGIPTCRGIGRGAAVIIGSLALPPSAAVGPLDPQQEQQKISEAIARVRDQIQAKLAAQPASVEAGILKAHLSIAADVSLSQRIFELIAQGRSAGQAVVEAGEFFIARLREAGTVYVRERAIDLQDICLQLLEQLYGSATAGIELTQPSVVIAANLTPRQLLALNRDFLKGLVLEHAGTTSHTIILARSFRIPTLAGVSDAASAIAAGQDLIVDANAGMLITHITPAAERYHRLEQEKIAQRQRRLAAHIHSPAATSDGRPIEIAANVSTAEEVSAAFEQGAEGVGVFRTEMLFMGREAPPSEDEQFAIYAKATQAAGSRFVTFRTLDVGGDKPVPYLPLPREANPFLGCRGVRIYPQFEYLIVSQIRAILRASAFGAARILMPMVSSVEEVRWVRDRIAAIKADLSDRGIAHNPAIPVGIMIEVPSAAFLIDQLAHYADFFSIGTNDLAQYVMAADRDNPAVAALRSDRHPALLRVLKKIVDDVHRCGKPIALCGEMGADLRNLPLLLGLGLDEISMAAPAIPPIKLALPQLSAAKCASILAAAMDADCVESVDRILADAASASAVPLIEPDLVLMHCDAASKEEAIKRIIDAFYVAGRTDDTIALEEAVWARETVYSTGLGHGFAIPHCKTTGLISANTIGIARLAEPIHWGAVDGQPVSMVILLAVRDADAGSEHLKLFATLARKLMHEDFRDQLLSAADPATLISLITAA